MNSRTTTATSRRSYHETQRKSDLTTNYSSLLIKTTNFYRLDTLSYKQLLNTAMTKSYKKALNNSSNTIISDEKKIPKNLGFDNRIDAIAAKDSFITLKDHKPNFKNNPTCRLINPSKSEIGIVSK